MIIALKSLKEMEQNDSLFVLIFELDEENEIDNQENWIKANPNIGKSIPYLDFENTIKKARGFRPNG